MDLTERTVSKQVIYEGKVIDLEVHDVTLPDGNEGKREIVKHPGAVAVLAINAEGNIPLVRQFRKATEQTLLEIPAGKRETGERATKTAFRELKEETGYVAGKLTEIGGFYTSPGFADEYIHIFLAEQLTDGEQQVESDEFLSIEMWTKEEAFAHAASGKFQDAKTAYSILALLARENSTKCSS